MFISNHHTICSMSLLISACCRSLFDSISTLIAVDESYSVDWWFIAVAGWVMYVVIRVVLMSHSGSSMPSAASPEVKWFSSMTTFSTPLTDSQMTSCASWSHLTAAS